MGFTDKHIEKINKAWADHKGFSAKPSAPTQTQSMLAELTAKYPKLDLEFEADQIFYNLQQRFMDKQESSTSFADDHRKLHANHLHETAQYVFDENKRIASLMDGNEKDSARFVGNIIRDAIKTFRKADRQHTAYVLMDALEKRYEYTERKR